MNLKIGILAASRIAPRAIIEPARAAHGVTIATVAARDPARARAFADAHGVPETAESYDALIARPDLDLIYIATPPSHHAQWSIAALQAGKHALCEKPFTVSAAEAQAVQAAANAAGRRVIEATHYRYHPMMARALDILQSGALGRLVGVDAEFVVPIKDTGAEFRRDPALGGGAFRDIGFYPLHLARTLLAAEPAVSVATAVFTDRGVDERLDATLLFRGDVPARVTGGMGVSEPPRAWAEIKGEGGRLRLDNFVAPQIGARITLQLKEGPEIVETPDPRPTFLFQLEAVRDALASGAPLPTEGADVVGQMRAMDAIYRAAGL